MNAALPAGVNEKDVQLFTQAQQQAKVVSSLKPNQNVQKIFITKVPKQIGRNR